MNIKFFGGKSKMLLAIFLYLALLSNLFDAGHSIDCHPNGLQKVVYVSKYRGKTSHRCGSKSVPCKTLKVGINKLRRGGQLYIDGEHTAIDPYKCESSAGKLVVKKSITIQRYTTTAHVSCMHGILLNANGHSVSIIGVQFHHTSIFLKDTSAVFRDSNFTASAPAITADISREALYSLDIQNAVFTRNLGCIQVNVKKGSRCRSIFMKLQDTLFQNNTTPLKANGLISVNLAQKVLFFSSWKNVTVLNNRGTPTIFDGNNKKSKKSYFPTKELSGKSTNNVFVVDGCSVNLTFTEVTSVDNKNMRFLDAQSGNISIRIQNSSYFNHHIDKPGGVMHVKNKRTKGYVNVSITDTIFNNNSGSLGGVLTVDGKKDQNVRLNMTNVTLLHSYGSVNGCTVSIGSVKRIFAAFDSLDVEECHDPCMGKPCKRYPAFCLRASQTENIAIKNSHFKRNKNQVFLIEHTSDRLSEDSILDVQITNTSFIHNYFSGGKKPTVDIRVSSPKEMRKSVLNISQSWFSRNKGEVIFARRLQKVYVRNSICEKTLGNCVRIDSRLTSILDIANCIFNENRYNLKFLNIKPLFVNISLKNTTFHKNYDQNLGVEIRVGQRGLKNIMQFGRLSMDQVHFTSNYVSHVHGSVLGVIAAPSRRIFTVIVRNSVFKHNLHKFRQNNTAFVNLFYFYIPPVLSIDNNMNSPRAKNQSCPKYLHRNKSSIFFRNVTFFNNTALTSSLLVKSGIVSFHRCLFQDNFSFQPDVGGHVYVDKGATTVRFYDTIFIQTKKIQYTRKVPLPVSPLLFFGAQGPLIMKNTSFKFDLDVLVTVPMFIVQRGHSVDIDNKTIFVCPVGSYLKLFNATFTLNPNFNENSNCKLTIIQLRFGCRRCPANEYTLESGLYRGTKKKKNVRCLACPFGANCTTKNIKSRPNFWGYKIQENPPILKFEKCPEGYCEKPGRESNLSTYNKCVGHRHGTMCGACKTGFTENMFNHKCCPVRKCRDHWFWVVAGMYSVIMATLILYRPSLILFLIKKVLWFRAKKDTIPNSRVEQIKKTHSRDGHAYFKIIFYFYQVAELLMLESFSEIAPKLPYLTSIISFFNFEVDTHNSSFGCPFPGLTSVTKELFRCAQVFAVMAIVVLFYFLHWLFALIRKSPRPHFAPYLAAIIEVLLLGYERLGHTSLRLLNCTPLDMLGKTEWRLVLDGNIKCWVHWWQYLMIAYNIVFVIPFLLVFWVGTSKLKRQQISAFHFVAACFVPLPFLLYWLLRHCLRCDKDVEEPNHWNPERENALLEILQGPFRQPDNQSKGALYWDSILIGRRLVLLCLFSFIAKVLPRLLCMTLVCMLILIHNVIVMPYKDRKANIFAIVLLSIHVVMATINLGESVLITAGVTFESPLEIQIDGFKTLEIVLLSVLPCAFILLVAVVVLSQTVRLLLMFGQYCLKDSEDVSNRHASYQPLLDSSEESRYYLY